jgi:hypothetical protein
VGAYILLEKESFIAASRMAIQARLSMKNPEKESKFLIELNTKLEKIPFDKNRLVLAKKHQDEIKILKAMNSSVPA